MERETNCVEFVNTKTETVICVKTVDGEGTKDSPSCLISRYWTLDGRYIGQVVQGNGRATLNPNARWNKLIAAKEESE